jgi:hypothetical protein
MATVSNPVHTRMDFCESIIGSIRQKGWYGKFNYIRQYLAYNYYVINALEFIPRITYLAVITPVIDPILMEKIILIAVLLTLCSRQSQKENITGSKKMEAFKKTSDTIFISREVTKDDYCVVYIEKNRRRITIATC